MISLCDKETGNVFGVTSEDDARFLQEQLESESTEVAAFFVDTATVDMLRQNGASAALLNLLAVALSGRSEGEIVLVGAPAMEDPHSSLGSVEISLLGAVPAVPDYESGRDGDDDVTNAVDVVVDVDVDDTSDDDDGNVTIKGRELKCVVCGHTQFERRYAQLHTALASFFNVEWLGRTASCYVCRDCGYIHWFLK